MKNTRSWSRIALSSFLGLALGAPVTYADVEYGLLAGASYSDNVLRTPTDEQSSGAGVVGFDLRGTRPTGRLTYDAYADVEYFEYFEDGVDSQVFGRASTTAAFAFAPERFEWLFAGAFDQVREDLLRPIAPDNVEDVITASTGPRLTFRFGDAWQAQLQAHYAMVEYSERELDNETLGGEFTFGRRISERTYLGLGATYDEVTYDVSPGVVALDFERREYFLRFNTEGARTMLQADVGYAEIEGVGGIQLDDGLLARMRLTRQLTPFISGFIGYVREFPTSAEGAFTPDPAQGGLGGDASILSAAPREIEDGQVGLELRRPRTAGYFVYTRRRESLVGAASVTRDFDQVSASIERSITTRSSIAFYGSYMNEKLPASPGPVESDETVFGALLHLAFGRSVGVEIRVEHRERDSDAGFGDYEELSGGIFLRYRSARRQEVEAR